MNVALTPALKHFVDEQVENGRFQDASDVIRNAVRRMEAQARLADIQQEAAVWTNMGSGGDGDIMASAFIVMMEAAQSAREDLKAIMDQMKAMNTAKRALREVIGKVRRDVAANAACEPEKRALDFTRGLGSERAYHRLRLPVLDPDAAGGVRMEPTDVHRAKIECVETLQAIVDDLQGKLDSLSEMGEMESLRLQMAMDRLSKLMSTLSNMLKKSSETAASIVQNLK